jgi:Ca-activated chloride channel family protein
MRASRKGALAGELLRIVVILAVISPSACVAQTPQGRTQAVTVTQGQAQGATVIAASGQEITLNAGLESAYVLQGSPGEAYLVLDLAAAAVQGQAVRPSMGVALVIDRSGSMAGDKIVNARAAAASFLQSLADGDVVSVYQYDDVVEQVAAPTVVDANSRAYLTAVVQGIQPRGSTNLHGGLVAGIESLSSALAERPVRRVILISDGLANVGPSSPMELGNTAAVGASRGISVTTIGVGLDYDESVMGTVAVRSQRSSRPSSTRSAPPWPARSRSSSSRPRACRCSARAAPTSCSRAARCSSTWATCSAARRGRSSCRSASRPPARVRSRSPG